MSNENDPFESIDDNQSNNKTFAIVLLLTITCILVVAAVYLYFSHKTVDSTFGCPVVNGEPTPVGHTIVLVDETDPLSPIQADFFKVQMEQLVRKQMKDGELLSLYSISGDPNSNRRPLIEVCKPRDGSDANPLNENEKLMKKRFYEKFAKPIDKLIEKLTSKKEPEKISPIMETIQFASVNSLRKWNVRGERKLLIFSDMLQNTEGFSLYRGTPSFTAFEGSPYASETKAYLPNVGVQLYYFVNDPRLQTKSNLAFWEQYFLKDGATVDSVIPVGK
ncbi:hypothetical protein MUN46_009285 [Mesosutterella sp. AGMB02718]|uniref:Uncharacterized protein n=1 Tax=Mesosutterella faecium TaxID=2925194 RepID=A0ABT7IS44_9BURK|nr:hypothetical protein [Mesosutterella sp. AGMB02718]MDL2060126.1 hypothetical protein [Mesosutterella sp. AGMB02718]